MPFETRSPFRQDEAPRPETDADAPSTPLLTLPSPEARALTVRAKALVFADPASRALLQRIEQVAPSEATVLITGETGTGKEIVARHVHELSRRKRGPFVAVNCGAFSETLVESELFGHEKGAFTGAVASKAGWFEAAHGGTLFLDEVGDLPPPVQVKLLRVLQEREVVRVGSRRPIPIDVRLVAATNVNLEEAVQAGRFREDLFYRLAVAGLALPPLRERRGDIRPLAEYFLGLYSHRMGLPPLSLTEDALAALSSHTWPGNIRELENVVHQALLVCRGVRVEARDLHLNVPVFSSSAPARSIARVRSLTPAPVAHARPVSASAHDEEHALERALERLFEKPSSDLYARIEARVLTAAYGYCDRNQLATARLLGISRNVVRARLIACGVLKGAPRSSEPRERGALSDDDLDGELDPPPAEFLGHAQGARRALGDA